MTKKNKNNTTKYPNQREVMICKDQIDYTGRSGAYMGIYVDNLYEVSRHLKEGPFKVFLYLYSNTDGYIEGLSPQKISNLMGLSISTIKRSVRELINEGYLVQSKHKKNRYEFALVEYDEDDEDGEAEAPPPEPPLETDIYEEEDFFDDLFPPQRAGKTNTITERKEIEVRTSGLEDND